MLERRPVVIVAGDEVVRAGARGDLARLAVALDARVTVTPDARDAFDNGDPRFAGVTGAMGHESATRALTDARVCLLLGTRLPLLARMGQEAILAARPLVSIAREAPFVAAADSLHVGGDLEINLRALVSELDEGTREAAVPTGIAARLASEDRPGPAGSFGSEDVLAAAERALPDAGVVLVDAGGTGAHAVHHVRAPRGGHWLVAMGMAGMGYTFGAAIGAALATGRRVLVLAGDGAFFMHGLEVHTAVQHRLPITYVIFNNKAHGMCLMRERLLLGEEGGYNAFLTSHIGGGLAAMFPGLPASDCSTIGELEAALGRARAVSGPAVVCAELPTVEVPPFAALRAALGGRRPAVNPSAPK
jgi:acetolactate synthase-1/2/3 large subunit